LRGYLVDRGTIGLANASGGTSNLGTPKGTKKGSRTGKSPASTWGGALKSGRGENALNEFKSREKSRKTDSSRSMLKGQV